MGCIITSEVGDIFNHMYVPMYQHNRQKKVSTLGHLPPGRPMDAIGQTCGLALPLLHEYSGLDVPTTAGRIRHF